MSRVIELIGGPADGERHAVPPYFGDTFYIARTHAPMVIQDDYLPSHIEECRGLYRAKPRAPNDFHWEGWL